MCYKYKQGKLEADVCCGEHIHTHAHTGRACLLQLRGPVKAVQLSAACISARVEDPKSFL